MAASSSRHPFVDDLIPLILNTSDHWWTQDYLRLSYVSSSWLFWTRKRLYSCPSLCSFTTCDTLARTLRENPDLRQLVSGIELQPMNTGEAGNVSAKHIASVRYLLGLDGLKRVKLGGQLARKAERFLNTLAWPDQVEELVVDGRLLGDAIGSSASLEWDDSMFYRFPSLRTLKLANLELDILPPSAPPCHTPINHLILDTVDICGFLCHIINGASVNLLSIWAKSALEYDEQVRLVLENCDVQALQYEVRISHRQERSFLDVERTEGLSIHRLRLEGHAVDDGLLAEIARRCQRLEELIILGRANVVTPGGWESFIASRSLSRLARVGLPGGSFLPPFVKWSPADIEAIQDAAACHNIDIVN